MLILNNCKQKVELEYPCVWLYKVIGGDQQEMRRAITEIIAGSRCLITPSNRSSSGKYHCLNVEVVVAGDQVRDGIFRALKSHPAIKMVL